MITRLWNGQLLRSAGFWKVVPISGETFQPLLKFAHITEEYTNFQHHIIKPPTTESLEATKGF